MVPVVWSPIGVDTMLAMSVHCHKLVLILDIILDVTVSVHCHKLVLIIDMI